MAYNFLSKTSFLKKVINKVVKNILNYNNRPYLLTGKPGVLALTGPIVYSIEILKLLDYKPSSQKNKIKYKYKIYYSHIEANFIYNALPKNHTNYFKNHYSLLTENIVLKSDPSLLIKFNDIDLECIDATSKLNDVDNTKLITWCNNG